MWTFITQLFGVGGGILTNWLDRKKAESDAKLERAKTKQQGEQDWDKKQVEASDHSWKDEYWTIVLSIPAILAFFPSQVEAVRKGFEVLDGMPDWYKASLITAIAAAFGVRQLTRFMSARRKK